jgi:lipoate-protein ligase A
MDPHRKHDPRLHSRRALRKEQGMSFDDVFRGTVAIGDPEPHDAARNMALDEALLLLARSAVLRVYRWQQPAVSFGYFGKFAAITAAWPGREIVRRTTGGGAVPHGRDITYTLAVPSGHPLAQMSARESYRSVHALLARWLSSRGLATALAPAPLERGSGTCFESPVEADVLGAVGKLAGAAQRRTREGLLLQGSIQSVPTEWSRDLPVLFGARQSRGFTRDELALAERLTGEKYGTRAWTERV